MTRARANALPRRQTRSVNLTDFEFRDAGDGNLTLEGYASTFEQPYSMGWYEETIRSGAFTKTLTESPDVRLLINHEGLPLARTRSGTMQLAQDTVGLHFRAGVDPINPRVTELRSVMERGDADQCSFGFDVVRQEWSSDYSQRSMLELSLQSGDVSVVTYPANANATASLRSLQRAIDTDPEKLRALYKELREGKVLSAANVDILARVLETLTVLDGYVDQMDVDLDSAQAQLADLLGVNDPDPADPTTPDTPDLEGNDAATEDEVVRSMPLSLYRARAEALRLKAS